MSQFKGKSFIVRGGKIRPRKTKIQKLTTKVNRIANLIETKHHDETQTEVLTSFDNEQVSILFDPIQGDGENARVGDVCSPFRIMIKGSFRQTVSGSGGVFGRVMLIQSKQRFVPLSASSGSDSQSVWESAGTNIAHLSQYIVENRSHYKVLFDRTYAIGGEDSSKDVVLFNINKRITSNVRFTTGGTNTERGGIFLLFTSNRLVSQANGPFRAWTSRVLFKDA